MTAPSPQSSNGRWLGLVALTLGVSMIIVDSTVINVAIPSIIDDLDVPLTTAQWATSVYSLIFAALLITCGRLADIHGRRRLFVAGIWLFLLASLAAGLAQSGAWLIGARILQGCAGALILPGALSSLNATFQGRERAMAFGIWGAVIGGMVALGPLVGGLFTTHMSWRWAFFVNLPVGLLAVAGALRYVQESSDPDARPLRDLFGVVTSALGIGLAIFTVIEGNRYGWWDQRSPFSLGPYEWPSSWIAVTPAAAISSVALLIAFAISQRLRHKVGRPLLINVSLYRIPTFRLGNFAAMIVSLGELGLVFILPLYLQQVLDYSAFDTGVLLLALSIGAFAAAGAAANLTSQIGARRVVIAGFALEVLGILGLAMITSPTTSGWAMVPFLTVYGLGVGLATAQLTSIVLADVPVAASGQASGLQSTTRQLGAALGIAILGSVFVLAFMTRVDNALDQADVSPTSRDIIVGEITRTGGARFGLSDVPRSERSKARTAVEASFVEAARIAAIAAAGFVFLGLLAAVRLPRDSAQPEQAQKLATTTQ